MNKKVICILAMLFLLTTAISSIAQNNDQNFGELSSNTLFSPELDMVDIPESYDLRDVDGNNYVTSVKDQTGGTCWCHGTMASMESNVLFTGVWEDYFADIDEPNFAEYHLDWWNGFNSFYNEDKSNAEGLDVHMGGDYRVASAYFTRGEGAVYDPSANDDSERDMPWYHDAPERYDEDYVVFYPFEIEWFVAGEDLANIDVIKEQIMTHGALGTCMCYSSRYMDVINNSYCSHYQYGSEDPNHSIAIIGWDDSKVTQAPELGAWLCKNSWGSSYCDEGYFWISYYDHHSGQHPEMGAVSFQHVVPNPFGHFYYHDYHGWRDTFTESNEVFNAFTAVSDDPLCAVSFYTATDDVAYTVKIFDTFENNVLSNELTMISGTIDYTGFHTIMLDSIIPLTEGDDFFVYLDLSQGGQPFDRTSEIPVLLGSTFANTVVPSNAEPGESYYYLNGSWIDFFDYDFPFTIWEGTANFCVKALTAKQADLSCDDSITWKRVNPGDDVSYTISIENIGESFSQLSWEIVETPSWGTWSITPNSGSLLTPEQGSLDIDITVIAPENKNKEFNGELKIVNTINADDFEIIPITLNTQRSSSYHPIFELIQSLRSYFSA
jgi:C1A family cysteine protease